MKLQKAIHHICYSKDPKKAPGGVSQARWNAIYKQVTNNWKTIVNGLDRQFIVCYNAIMLMKIRNTRRNKMSERLTEFIISGLCFLTILAGSIFGAWALFQTMGM